MPGWQKAQRVASKIMRLAEIQGDDLTLQAEAGQHQLMRQRGTNRELVPRDMVAVRMGNEGRIHASMRVQPQANVWQMDAATLVSDMNQGLVFAQNGGERFTNGSLTVRKVFR